MIYVTSNGQRVQTQEGKLVVNECIAELSALSPLCPVEPSPLLEKAALDHSTDTANNNITGHNGTDGSSPFDRMNRYCRLDGVSGECVDYGNTDAADVLLALLIDDGVPSRGHRKNMCNPEYTLVGAAVGKHETYGSNCVVDLASKITDLSLLVREDVVVMIPAGGTIADQFEQVLNSIPDPTPFRDTIDQQLTAGNSISLDYNYTGKTAKLTFTSPGGGGGSMSMSW